MSLGLGDVSKRKKRARAKSVAAETGASWDAQPPPLPAPAPGESAPLNAALGAARPARPWSTAGLARQGVSRMDSMRKDAHLSDEWAQLHEAPLFWIDLRADSRVAAAHEALVRLEEKVRDLAQGPAACLAWLGAAVKSTLK